MIYADEMALAFRYEHPVEQLAHYTPKLPTWLLPFVVPGQCYTVRLAGVSVPVTSYCPTPGA